MFHHYWGLRNTATRKTSLLVTELSSVTHPGAKLGFATARRPPARLDLSAPAKHSFEDGCVTECNSVTRHVSHFRDSQ